MCSKVEIGDCPTEKAKLTTTTKKVRGPGPNAWERVEKKWKYYSMFQNLQIVGFTTCNNKNCSLLKIINLFGHPKSRTTFSISHTSLSSPHEFIISLNNQGRGIIPNVPQRPAPLLHIRK